MTETKPILKIKAIAKEKGYSIKRLCNEAGVSCNTVYAAIKRKSNLTTDTASRLAKVLKISVYEVTGETNEIDFYKDEIFKLSKENEELKITINQLIKMCKVGD